MNSFQDLNYYSNIGIPFGDDRAYSITFSSNTVSNTSSNINEGTAFTLSPGINITALQSTPRPITFTVNVANCSGANVSWVGPISGVTTTIAANGSHIASGINGKDAWDQIKYSTVSMPRDYTGTWVITNRLTYPNTANVTLSNTFTWLNTVTVLNLEELSTPNSLTYNQYADTAITSYPQITDEEPDGIYNLCISANGTSAINSIVSYGVGGNVIYDNTNRIYKISGYRSEVNSRLRYLTFRPEFNYVNNFTMYYTMINPVSNISSQVSQTFNIGSLYPVLSGGANIEYTQDTNISVTNYYQLPDDSSWGTNPTYTITVTPSTTNAINTITTSGSGGTSSFNNGSKVLTISGTRTAINSYLSTMIVTTPTYYNQNFTLTYRVTSPGGDPLVQYFNIGTIGVTLSPVTDLTYDEDIIKTQIPVPTILDTNFGIASITLPFTFKITPTTANAISSITSSNSSAASRTSNNTTKSYTIAGNLSQIRTELGNVTILPGQDYNNNFKLYYTLTTISGNVNANVTQNWLIGNTNVATINQTNNRYYNKNTVSQLFPNTVPSIDETVSGSPEYIVKLTLASNIGTIISSNTPTLSIVNGNITILESNWYSANLTYVATGVKSSVNSILTGLYFVPNKDISANTTLTYNQSRNGTTQTTANVTLIGANRAAYNSSRYIFYANGSSSIDGTYSASNETFTPTLNQILFQQCEFLATAGGGRGGYGEAARTRLYVWGGGGGAGGLYYANNYRGFIPNLNYVINVGLGQKLPYQGEPYWDNASRGNPTTIGQGGIAGTPGIPVLLDLTGGGAGGSPNGRGADGGSGGGVGSNYSSSSPKSLTGGAGIDGQGYRGGNTYYEYNGINAGGGGGAMSAGGGYNMPPGYGYGGSGLESNISGANVIYSQGGYTRGFTGDITPGTGGTGGAGYFVSGQSRYIVPQPGNDGIVIIKFY